MTFDIGRVIGRTFAALGANPAVFFGLSFLVFGVAGTGSTYAVTTATQDIALGESEGSLAFLLLGGAYLASLVCSTIAQAAIIFAAIEYYAGRRASITASLSQAIPHILPLLAIYVLYAVGLAAGMILLIIPGIILWVLWSVVIPVRVAERTGILGSFSRSRKLTKGNRWSVFGLFIIYIMGVTVFSVGAGVLGLTPAPGNLGVMAIVGGLFVNTLLGAVMASGLASLYHELRTLKEGSPADEVVEVFS